MELEQFGVHFVRDARGSREGDAAVDEAVWHVHTAVHVIKILRGDGNLGVRL